MSKQPESNTDENLLVKSAVNGDEGAFVQLYEEMRGTLGAVVFKTLDRQTMVKEGASDVIQDALMRAWSKRGDLRDRTMRGFQAWLVQIVRNIAKDKHNYWRANIRNVELERQIDKGPDQQDFLPSPDRSSGQQRRIEEVWEAIDRLPAQQREAIRLQKFENWTQAQIAARLNRSESSVQGLLRRGKKALEKSLKGDDSNRES